MSAAASTGVHDHRLLEQHVQAGLETRGRLAGVERVRRDDEDDVEVGPKRSRNRDQSGSFGGAARPCLANSADAASNAPGDGSQTATISVSSRVSIVVRWTRPIAPVPIIPTRTRSGDGMHES
jgi:hypothetical protein